MEGLHAYLTVVHANIGPRLNVRQTEELEMSLNSSAGRTAAKFAAIFIVGHSHSWRAGSARAACQNSFSPSSGALVHRRGCSGCRAGLWHHAKPTTNPSRKADHRTGDQRSLRQGEPKILTPRALVPQPFALGVRPGRAEAASMPRSSSAGRSSAPYGKVLKRAGEEDALRSASRGVSTCPSLWQLSI
jgi:hypothetical protein